MKQQTVDKAAVLEALARKPQLVTIEGLGKAYVIPMSYAQRRVWSEAVLSSDTDEGRCMQIICECLVDELGKPLFSAEDAAAMKDGDGGIIQAIFAQVLTVSGLWKDVVKAAKKNSSKTTTSTLPTG
jgi:hypothetical protein